MSILIILTTFFIVAAVVKIATDNIYRLLLPFADVKKYKMVLAFILTSAIVLALNLGVLEALGVPLDMSLSWFHRVDIVITILFLTGGAQSIYRLDKAFKEYTKRREADE